MGVELLRVVSMVLIVAHHYLLHGGILSAVTLGSSSATVAWVIEAFCVVAVNCFVITSGYFMVTSEFKPKKLVVLWLQVFFYSATIYVGMAAAGLVPWSVQDVLKAFFPILGKTYWFATAYVAMVLLSPFLNLLIRAMDERRYRMLLVVLGVLYLSWTSFLPTLPWGFTYVADTSKGYSVLWFVCLYLLAGYLRLHWTRPLRATRYALVYVAASLVTASSLWWSDEFRAFYRYDSVTVVLASAALFLFMRSLRIEWTPVTRLIGALAPLTFGVYLISDNPHVRGVLYSQWLHTERYTSGTGMVVALVGSVVAIYAVCSAIDAIRRAVFRPLERSAALDRMVRRVLPDATKM